MITLSHSLGTAEADAQIKTVVKSCKYTHQPTSIDSSISIYTIYIELTDERLILSALI